MRGKIVAAAVVLTTAGTALAFAQQGSRKFNEFLNGFQEASVVVATTATGTFTATISPDETEIAYELTFNNLEGDVRQAHIHIGYPQNQGNIVLWLCETEQNQNPNTAAPTPSCLQDGPDQRSGRVTGTLTATDIIVQTANGIESASAAEFAQVVSLIKAGRTYVNVHTVKFPPGEIRSQLDNRGEDNGGQGAAHRDH